MAIFIGKTIRFVFKTIWFMISAFLLFIVPILLWGPIHSSYGPDLTASQENIIGVSSIISALIGFFMKPRFWFLFGTAFWAGFRLNRDRA